MDTIQGQCPHCGNHITVDVKNSQIQKNVKTKKEIFSDAFKKVQKEESTRKDHFDTIQKNLKNKKKESEDLFKKGLGDIKEKGLGDKPIRDIDL